MESTSRFEVRCSRCDVSFPTGTRRCFHCGGRTGPSRFQAPDMPPELLGSAQEREEGLDLQMDEAHPADPLGDEAPNSKRRGRWNASVSLIWIVMALVFTLMRACGGG